MKTKMNLVVATVVLVAAVIVGLLYHCENKQQCEGVSIMIARSADSLYGIGVLENQPNGRGRLVQKEPYWNEVAGHDERNAIVGNFTGKGLDTLYVVAQDKVNPKSEDDAVDYWAVCSNPAVPKVKLCGYTYIPPMLVYEGDLDGNGRDEWGYLSTWMYSQFRTYRVFTLVGMTWRFLTDEWDLLATTEFFRASGKEILEPGPRKGTVKVNYAPDGQDSVILETVIVPNFAVIDAKSLEEFVIWKHWNDL